MDSASPLQECGLILRGNELPLGILRSALTSRRIANAYLLKGPRGSPKEALAERFAHALVCDSEGSAVSGDPCGQCWSCRVASNGAHPDLLEIEREGSTIKIKKSHEILKEALIRPYHSSRKVFLIKGAENLTVEASNALLKILEEPPAFVSFILTAANTRAIPETIVSRCQVVPVRKVPAHVLRDILVQEHGAGAEAAAEAASHADGDLERALRILGRDRGNGPRGALDEIMHGSAVEFALKYSKGEAARRVDLLTDLEIELVRRLRTQASLLDWEGAASRKAEREMGCLYRAVGSLLTAKERLDANCNAFLTMSVLFIELARALGD